MKSNHEITGRGKKLQTKMSVAIRCHDLEDTIVDCEQRNIKGSTSQVEHQDVLLSFFLVKSIRNGGCRSV